MTNTGKIILSLRNPAVDVACVRGRSASDRADGKDYDGNNKYVIHFAKDQMPPVNSNGFWSLTMI